MKVNGREERLGKQSVTLRGYLTLKGIRPEEVAVERNRKVVCRSELDHIQLKEEDELEIVRFVGGG